MTTGMHCVSSQGKPPRWLTKPLLIALHEESIARFGGSPGIRDEGLLESALERPRNLHAYENTVSAPKLAAAYGFGLARNHPFIDGNKRAALLAVAVFCHINRVRFQPAQEDEVRAIVSLAAGNVTETDLADWIADHSADSS